MAQISTTKCGLCNTNNGMDFCYECEAAMCGPCRTTHDKIPATKNHSITDLKRIDRLSFSSISICSAHKQEFSLYCTTCKILICSKCVATKHNGHDFSEIETIVNDVRSSVKRQIAEMKIKLQSLTSAMDEIRSVGLKTVGEDAQHLRSKIDSAVMDVQSVLEQKKEIQISEINDFEKFEKQEMQNTVESKERVLASSSAICSSLETILAEEHGITFLNRYKALKMENDELDDSLNMLKKLTPYSCKELNLSAFYKEVIKAIIQAANNALRDDGKPEADLLKEDKLEKTESMHVYIIELVNGTLGFGFSIAGGIGNQHIPGDNGIFVTKIMEGGAAEQDGRLALGDKLIAVNSSNLENVTHEGAVAALKTTTKVIRLTVVKPSDQPSKHNEEQSPLNHLQHVYIIELVNGTLGFGFSIAGGIGNQHIPGDNGIFVTKIMEGGAAEQDGRLALGDKLIAVNSSNLENVTHEGAVAALKTTTKVIRLTVVKQSDQPSKHNEEQSPPSK